MACLCEFELGRGNVDFQVVSGYHPAEFEEQYAVHVRDLFPIRERLRKVSLYPATFPIRNPSEPLILCSTDNGAWHLDTRTRITGTVSGIFWYITNRGIALGVDEAASA